MATSINVCHFDLTHFLQGEDYKASQGKAFHAMHVKKATFQCLLATEGPCTRNTLLVQPPRDQAVMSI